MADKYNIQVEDLSDALGVLEELLKLGPLASGKSVYQIYIATV